MHKTQMPLITASAASAGKLRAKTLVTVTASAGKAQIRITDYLGEWERTGSSKGIRAQVDEMLAAGINTAEVYINSGGGDCFEATEIANELDRFDTVTITVGAVAASAATYLTSCFETTVKDSSQIMVHKPSMWTGGNVDKIEADLKLLRNMTEQYRQKYAEKTGMTEAQIDELWAKGDVWMTAKEALKYKFIDAIEAGAEEEPTQEDVALLTACAAPFIPTLKAETTTQHQPSKPSSSKMERAKLIAALGLPADATDEQIEAAITANKAAADEAKVTATTAKQTAAVRAQTLVAKALNDKKIDASQKETFEKLAETDYDTTAQALESMQVKPKLSAMIGGKKTDAALLTARKDWDMDTWLDKDPEGLKALKDEQPEVYATLEKAYFGSRKK